VVWFGRDAEFETASAPEREPALSFMTLGRGASRDAVCPSCHSAFVTKDRGTITCPFCGRKFAPGDAQPQVAPAPAIDTAVREMPANAAAPPPESVALPPIETVPPPTTAPAPAAGIPESGIPARRGLESPAFEAGLPRERVVVPRDPAEQGWSAVAFFAFGLGFVYLGLSAPSPVVFVFGWLLIMSAAFSAYYSSFWRKRDSLTPVQAVVVDIPRMVVTGSVQLSWWMLKGAWYVLAALLVITQCTP